MHRHGFSTNQNKEMNNGFNESRDIRISLTTTCVVKTFKPLWQLTENQIINNDVHYTLHHRQIFEFFGFNPFNNKTIVSLNTSNVQLGYTYCTVRLFSCVFPKGCEIRISNTHKYDC